MDEHRIRLGDALIERADDIAAAVLQAVWPAGTAHVDADVLAAVAETDRKAACQIGEWLTGGKQIGEEERRSLGALGGMVDRINLDTLVKAYLSWRDVMLAVIGQQAAELGTPPALAAEVRAVVARNTDGSIVRMARRFEQERVSLHEQLKEQALHDPLTGLPNRVLLFDRMEHALRMSTRSARQLAILFVDLDGFKAVNDCHGHHVGDEVLTAVAGRICEAVRGADTVARLGGDEFVVLCEDVEDIDKPVQIAKRIISALSEPFVLGACTVSISGSVGIAGAGGAEGPSELLMHADTAMYAAKQQGPGHHEMWAAVGS
jgi:diguanylate cyclase (GGDEF)-like protein